MVYNDKWSSGGIGIYQDTDTIRYDFLSWVDESGNLVEISEDDASLQVRYPQDTIYIGTDVPLWIDTSWSNTWTHGMNISFSGHMFEVSRTTRTVEAGIFDCWYLSYDIRSSTQSTYIRFYYDVILGFLVIYVWTNVVDISFSQRVYELSDTNLRDFMFLGGLLNNPLVTVILSIGIGLELILVTALCLRRMKHR